MKFIQLIEQLARQVGTHQIPLNPAATQRQGLIDSSALHYELITRIVGAIYARNHCRRLTDPVECDATFEALAPIRQAVLRAADTDVEEARLLEDLCVSIAMVFEPHGPARTAAPRSPRGPQGASPVRLNPLRRRIKQ
jgi:hypothetical protein